MVRVRIFVRNGELAQILNFLPRDAMLARHSPHSTTPTPTPSSSQTSSRRCRFQCRVSVRGCVSDTLRYCIKSANRRITQIMPHDSEWILAFLRQRSRRNSNGVTPYGGDKCRWRGVKIGLFRQITRYNPKTVQDRRIVAIKVE